MCVDGRDTARVQGEGRTVQTMDVVVCIKQVPETADVKIGADERHLDLEDASLVINPFDTYAIEEGLRIKEAHGGSVTALSMGPERVLESLKEALAMGVDGAYLLSDPEFEDSDALATAYALACAIRKIGRYDLVLCGRQAFDGATGQVGPSLAEELGIPHVTLVRKIVDLGADRMRVERLVEGGYEVVETSLPALLTVVKEINEPRLPSLKGIMKAKKTNVPVWGAGDLDADPGRIGRAGSPTEVRRLYRPEARGGGELIEGEPPEQARALVERLREAKVV